MHDAAARRLLRPLVGDDRLAADGALPDDDHGDPTLRQVDIGPAAEADEPEALPGHDLLAAAQVADDAASDEAGDLHHGDIAAAVGVAFERRDPDRHPLVV